MVRLNLGEGNVYIDGYEGIDRKDGKEVYPLDYPDNSVDEIRASHILEHFGHHEVEAVVTDWVRVLKPGGLLQIAVPDFQKIAEKYVHGMVDDDEEFPLQSYVMGGQVDGDDFHKCIFDRGALEKVMTDAGLVDIMPWTSQEGDCAALPISLNLGGHKPKSTANAAQTALIERARETGAVMSMPRLTFTDNAFCSFEALVPLGIQLRKTTGAFWGQCLTRAMEEAIREGKKYILTLDYDTVFSKADVMELLRLSIVYPEADAIAPLQASRTRNTPLMTMAGADGNNLTEIPLSVFDNDLTRIRTAHFGLTLIKVSALQMIEKPWFISTPDANGEWHDGRVDDDIMFWRRWEDAGNILYLANHVAVGHAELMVRWPGKDMTPFYQHPSDFWGSGKPEGVWQ